MHTPSGDTWAALAYTQPPRVEVGRACKGGPIVTRGCVYFGRPKGVVHKAGSGCVVVFVLYL